MQISHITPSVASPLWSCCRAWRSKTLVLFTMLKTHCACDMWGMCFDPPALEELAQVSDVSLISGRRWLVAGIDMLWCNCVHQMLVNLKDNCVVNIFVCFYLNIVKVLQRCSKNKLSCSIHSDVLQLCLLWCFPSLASVCARQDETLADVTVCMHVYRSISRRQCQRWFPRAERDIDPSNPAQCWAPWLGRMRLYHTRQWLWLQQLVHFIHSTYCPDVSHIHWDFHFRKKKTFSFLSKFFPSSCAFPQNKNGCYND